MIKIFYALFFIASGVALIKYRKNVKSWTGNFAWAEHYLGHGGTYLVFIVFGMFLIFLGASYPFGGADFILWWDRSVVHSVPTE